MSEITGKIYLIKETQQVSESFSKREFIVCEKAEKVEWKDQYLKFEVIQDKCDVLDQYQVGDEVNVQFNIKGNKYTRKDGTGEDSFVGLQAWRINPVVNGQAGQGDQPPAAPEFQAVEDTPVPF